MLRGIERFVGAADAERLLSEIEGRDRAHPPIEPEMAALLALWMLASGAMALTIFPALLVVVQPRFLLRRRA